jgi:hypothetical protein
MNTTTITFLSAALLAASASAAPAPVQDRIAELCSVSNTDLEGQRLVRACRAEVRAQAEAERVAANTARRSLRTAAIDPPAPR